MTHLRFDLGDLGGKQRTRNWVGRGERKVNREKGKESRELRKVKEGAHSPKVFIQKVAEKKQGGELGGDWGRPFGFRRLLERGGQKGS